MVARAFNDLITGGVGIGSQDGRTKKRRARLFKELSGKGKPLKPVDVLGRVAELLDLGETLGSIRKARSAPRALPSSPELIELVQRLHAAYAFPVVSYRFVGVGDEVLAKAGIEGAAKRRAGRPRKRKAS